MRGLLAGLAFLACVSAAAAQTSAPAPDPTPAQLLAVQRALQVGQELYNHDRAAWLATDAMLADIADPRSEGVHGWVTERTADGILVLFVHPEGDRLSAIYRARYRDDALVEHSRVNRPLTDFEVKLYRDREIAVRAPFAKCAENCNTVTLPRAHPDDDGVDVDVYLMPAMAQAGEYPLGGYYRVGINSTTGVVGDVQPFTNSCITLTAPPAIQPQFLMITQIVTDTPTEVHVFMSLTTHMPIYVSSRSGLWEIRGAIARTVPQDSAMPNAPTHP